MKKQLWLSCKNKQEENELLTILKDYLVDIKCQDEKSKFPIVVDTNKKVAFRCLSISNCAGYVSSGGKILTLEEFKKINEA